MCTVLSLLTKHTLLKFPILGGNIVIASIPTTVATAALTKSFNSSEWAGY